MLLHFKPFIMEIYLKITDYNFFKIYYYNYIHNNNQSLQQIHTNKQTNKLNIIRSRLK